MNGYANKIVNGFIKIIKDFRTRGIINDEDLREHTKSDLHSWLQYALIKASERVGLFAVPEVKLRFTKAIDHKKYGGPASKGKRGFSKVDVAFYKDDKNLLGVAEIYTIDEAHGALSTKKLAKLSGYWLTPRDSLLHMIKYSPSKINFIILVLTLPRQAHRIPWKIKYRNIDLELRKDKNYYKVFKPYWKIFKEKIKVKNSLLIISEDRIEKI